MSFNGSEVLSPRISQNQTGARFENFGKTCLCLNVHLIPILTHSVATAKPTPPNTASRKLYLPPVKHEVACSSNSPRNVDVVARPAAGARQELNSDVEGIEK
jgi:hypothetical protein